MRKSVKVVLIIASSLVGIGVLFLGLSFAFGGMNIFFMPRGNSNYTVLTATFDEVETLEISDMSNDVRLVKSENDEVKVTYAMSENFGYYLKQIDNTLIIEYDDFREWYEFIGIFILQDCDLVVEVPEKTLDELTVKTVSGDIDATGILAKETSLESTSGSITAGGNVGELSVSAVSGDIKLNADTKAKNIDISTTSGNISLYGIAADDAKLNVTSGDIYLRNAQLSSIETDTMSGDVEFKDVTCSKDITADTTSGDIELEYVDAGNYYLSTTSGDIDAMLLSPKYYNVKSSGGSHPSNTGNAQGSFNAESVSGDIDVGVVK